LAKEEALVKVEAFPISAFPLVFAGFLPDFCRIFEDISCAKPGAVLRSLLIRSSFVRCASAHTYFPVAPGRMEGIAPSMPLPHHTRQTGLSSPIKTHHE
jgi:hypothetical protein